MQTKHQKYEMKLFEKEINFFPLEEYTHSKVPILHECLNGHSWKVTPSNILSGSGCPQCSSTKRKTQEEYINEISPEYTPLEQYLGRTVKILHKHIICGYEWSTAPKNLIDGYGCPKCSNKAIKLTSKYIEEIKETHEILGEYLGAGIKVEHRHKECGYTWLVKPNDILNRPNICPKCNGTGGFDKTKVGYLYFISLILDGTKYYKIGITNRTLLERFGSDWHNFYMEAIWLKQFTLGIGAYNIEQILLNKYTNNRVPNIDKLIHKGNTEILNTYITEKEVDDLIVIYS